MMEVKVVLLLSLLFFLSVLGQEIEEKVPEEKGENERNSKQLWPVMTSYFYPYQRSPQYVPSIPTLLSASNLFSKYTKSVGPKQSHQYLSNTLGNREDWRYRVKETDYFQRPPVKESSTEKDSSASSNLTKSADDDMEPSESSVNYLAATGRQNIFELNGSGIGNGFEENDVAPLDFPGIQAGDRNFSSTENTLNTAQVVTISGVGRPVSLPTSSVPKPQECCLFVFLDGSAYYFDEFMRKVTGFYRVMYGSVNGHPHYVARNCRNPDEYGTSCTYIWYSGYGWVVGVGKYIGQTKGVMFTRNTGNCPTGTDDWRYLDQNLSWQDNGNIYVKCAS